MIFILHYILFNAGLPATLVLLTLFLQTYSDASLTEIGTLLMALPFLSILIKPLCCALADRQHAHKLYLIGSLAFMALGYGSLVVAPFFGDFVARHGRLVWYMDVVGVIIGFSAFGVVWSLGDALAVNAAQVNGVSWGSYRVWAVVSWGVFGVLIGQINELPILPKYVAAFFVLISALVLEMILLSVWPNRHFVMGGEPAGATAGSQQAAPGGKHGDNMELGAAGGQLDTSGSSWGGGGPNRSWTGTMSGTAAARANPRLMGAVANIFMEDLGGTLKSSLRLTSASRGPGPKRTGLAEILERHSSALPAAASLPGAAAAANSSNKQQHPSQQASGTLRRLQAAGQWRAAGGDTPPASPSFGRAALRRTQLALSRMNSLSAASGTAIAMAADEPEIYEANDTAEPAAERAPGTPPPLCGSHAHPHHHHHHNQQQQQNQQAAPAPPMYMSSVASGQSLSRAAAARALGLAQARPSFGSPSDDSGAGAALASPHDASFRSATSQLCASSSAASMVLEEEAAAAAGPTGGAATGTMNPDDLQLVLLKLILKRDVNIWKYLALFTMFGVLLTLHLSYFFLHLEQLCREHQVDFSSITGAMMAAHSISEVFSFTVVVPYYVPRVGRVGALLTCACVYAIRFAYYGTYLGQLSPYTGIPFELCHGIAYGIIYSLITDIAVECVNQVDAHLPELVERGLVRPDVDPNLLKLPLRATMQGVFSGAFDGLGNGIGALVGGVYLDGYSFASLWQLCFLFCVALVVVYPLSEWRALRAAGSRNSDPSSDSDASSDDVGGAKEKSHQLELALTRGAGDNLTQLANGKNSKV